MYRRTALIDWRGSGSLCWIGGARGAVEAPNGGLYVLRLLSGDERCSLVSILDIDLVVAAHLQPVFIDRTTVR
jgi:hypothetical protein